VASAAQVAVPRVRIGCFWNLCDSNHGDHQDSVQDLDGAWTVADGQVMVMLVAVGMQLPDLRCGGRSGRLRRFDLLQHPGNC